MSYCKWCELESDSEDFCVWCKRPLGSDSGFRQAKSDLHYLRNSEDDGSEGPFPIFAILGAVAFLAIIILAIMNFHPAAHAEEPAHWTLADQQGQGVPQGE